ncbi:MAG: hypothetical protein HZB26_24305 [Candidatus Hydrogenedentes bacterium]|nr:hypothetical protein [Candidatus Hydrogenedentota bacterium]
MAKGTIYETERVFMRDPRSGLTVTRLTHSSCIAQNLYFEMCSFTKDDAYVVLISQRYAGRDAPWDLFRIRTDGHELIQLTECDDLSGIVFSPAQSKFFYQSKGELHRLDVHTLKDEAFAKAPGANAVSPRSLATIDENGAAYIGSVFNDKGEALIFKTDTANGKTSVLHSTTSLVHLHVDPQGKTLFFIDHKENTGPSLIDTDGKNLRPYPFRKFSHHTWFGKTGLMQGTLVPPGAALVTVREGDPEPVILAEGRYYWHSSASVDAQWIISDTNWPQEGLFLLHVPTRTVTYVCDTRSSCSHPQWSHPHPALSPTMKYVLYNSDMTGIGQVYLANLTEEFLEKASRGYTCQPTLLA